MDNIQAMEAQMLAESMLEIGPINDVLEIDAESRTINVPANELIFGVVTDQDVERKYFRCPKIVGDNIDLSSLSLRVHFENATGEKDKYIVDDLKVDGNYVTFSWLLSKKVLMYNGDVNFTICAVYTKADGTLVNKWNTTLASGNVLNGLEVDDLTEDEETEARDVLQQLLNLLNIQTEETIQSVKAEGESQINKVKSEGAAQIEDISNEGLRVLNTIPEDYTSMNEQVGMLSRLTGPVIKQEVEGESIAVKDSAKMPLLGLQMYGNSSQRTTTGAQVIPYPFFNDNKDQNGISWTHQNRNDGSINVKGTATAKSVLYFTNSLYHMEAGTYTISGSTKDIVVRIDSSEADTGAWKAGIAISQDGVPVTFTLSEEDVAKYTYTLYASIESGLTVDTVIYPMINKGDTALPWEPYTGGQASPNPEYPQEIVSVENPTTHICGKNIIDISEGLNESLTVDDDVYTLTMLKDVQRFSGIIPVYIPANTPFTVTTNIIESTKTTATLPFYFRDADGVSYYVNSNGTPLLRTYDKDMLSLRFYIQSSDADGSYVKFEKFQIEIGETATDYELPKTHQEITISNSLPGIPVKSGGNYTDENGQQWICDEVNFERGVYIQRLARVDLKDCTCYKNNYPAGSNLYRFAYAAGPNPSILPSLYADIGYCTHYDVHWAPVSGNAFDMTISSYAAGGLYIRDDRFETAEEFMKWVKASDFLFVYPIANPIETPIPEEELQAYRALHTNYPNTTIINDSGAHMKLTYATDTKMYIDNKFAELLKP